MDCPPIEIGRIAQRTGIPEGYGQADGRRTLAKNLLSGTDKLTSYCEQGGGRSRERTCLDPTIYRTGGLPSTFHEAGDGGAHSRRRRCWKTKQYSEHSLKLPNADTGQVSALLVKADGEASPKKAYRTN